jgi:hypothetical protein
MKAAAGLGTFVLAGAVMMFLASRA